MKRILSLILSLVLCFSLATVSLAASTDTTTTTTAPDGSIVKTQTKTEVVKHEDGSTTTIKTTTTTSQPSSFSGSSAADTQSKVAIEVSLSRNASATTAETKEAVLLPLSAITASDNTADATTITIDTGTKMGIIVEVPVADMNFGVVAVIVNEDGTETIINNSMPSAYGVIITVTDGATIKIIDNGKDFQDVTEDFWYKSAVDFVSAREIMNGTDDGTFFLPNIYITRAMIWTMLARLDGVDTSVGETWYEGGQTWAMENGISDGTNHNAEVTREQLITMLWRYWGEPASDYNISYFNDHQKTSDWALSAMKWAASNGIITGTGGDLNPDRQATRAQVAQIFYNFLFVV